MRGPFRNGLVVDSATREQPLAIHLDHFVLVVAEEVDGAASVGSAGHVRPVRHAARFVAVQLDDDVADDAENR